MKSIYSALFIVATLLTTASASAGIVATYSKGTWDSAKETHVIHVSQGFPFPSVGYTQASVIKEMYPDNQILFITTLPDASSSNYKTKSRALIRADFSIAEETSEVVSTKVFLRILRQYSSNIRSLDIIGHNGVEKGPWLHDDPNRLDYKNEALMSSIRSLFNPKAYARLQGCNTGWNVAPKLSKAWGIPILGSFTSTSFYFLAKNGAYELLHRELPQDRLSSFDAWSFVSDNGVASRTDCPSGVCLTLMPEAAPYHFQAHKSSQAAWLPFRKAICDASIADSRCEMAWAEGILTSITPLPRKTALTNKEAFRDMLQFTLCASYSDKSAQAVCMSKVRREQSQGIYSLPYRIGTMLKCSGLRACNFVQDSIDLRKNSSSSSENTIKLYFDHALRGHDLLGGKL